MKSVIESLTKTVSLTTTQGEKITWGHKDHWVLFAGPDIFESEGLVLEVATELKKITSELGIPWILKCSFDKANRTSSGSFRGPGASTAIKGLAKIKAKVGCALVTDVHDIAQINAAAEIADVLQIPAFLSRQTDLLQAAAKTGKVLNIKKGQFLAPWDMKSVAEKCTEVGNAKVLLCERGTSFGYNRLINDMTGLADMRALGFPVVMDATHSVQLPSGKGTSSDGRRDMIEVVARAAMAVGVDGFFFETHPDPDKALCDGPNSLHLKDMRGVLTRLQRIRAAIL
ncbi:MAG: 3-deoxy-8-phosphooctulonate synthase [Bdellovibrionales bacterium]|nr:3-deoxy-8-phosphooctulonate synthase [Bdellovibrionales bacterium]